MAMEGEVIGSGSEQSGWRVKLYQLEAEGAWLDKGTGCVHCRSVEGTPSIVVQTEDGTGTILDSKIRSDDVYERQGESIIMWRDPATSEFVADVDYALSFQDSVGCTALWECITAVQRQYLTQQEYGQAPFFANTAFVSRNRTEGWSSPLVGSSGASMLGMLPSLPTVGIETLGEIRDKFTSMHISQKDAFAQLVLDKGSAFVVSLLGVSSQLEDLEDTENLSKIADICRCMMLLNDSTVLDLLVSDTYFLAVAGVMEYDSLLKTKHEFRMYLSGTRRRRDVPGAELRDPLQKAAIEKLFRLRFLRDSLARPALEESGSAAIDSAINIAMYDVCARLLADLSLMLRILLVICPTLEVPPLPMAQSTTTLNGLDISNGDDSNNNNVDSSSSCSSCSSESAATVEIKVEVSRQNARFDALTFLRELFHTSRSLSFDRRTELYNRFCLGEGFGQVGLRKPFFLLCLDVLSNIESTPIERSLIVECMVCLVTVCPNHLRQTILQGSVPSFPQSLAAVQKHQITSKDAAIGPMHQNNKSILWVLVQRLAMDSDHALLDNVGEIVRVLLDPDRFERQEKDNFLGVFYDHYIYWLLVPFAEEHEPDKELPREIFSATDTRQSQTAVLRSRRILVDLLCLCVVGHSYRMKYFVIRNGAINLILRLMKSSRLLQLSAIKFLRSIIASKDEFYNRHVVKQDLLLPILDLLKLGKDGLVTSSVLEMVDYVCTEGIKTLLSYLVEKHGDCFVTPLCAEMGEKLKWAHEKGKSADSSFGGKIAENQSTLASAALRQKRQQERDSEDEYFFDDDVFAFNPEAPATTTNPLALIASAYGQDEAGSNENKDEMVSENKVDATNVELKDNHHTLPPLKPKFEVDDEPETLLRTRCKESDLARLSSRDEAEANCGDSEGNGATSASSGVSFSMKKRVSQCCRCLACNVHSAITNIRVSISPSPQKLT